MKTIQVSLVPRLVYKSLGTRLHSSLRYWIARTILVSYPDLPMRYGYETSATLQACTHDYSVHKTVMEELLQLNEYSVALH